MTKLHHTEYKKNYINYILDCVDIEDCTDIDMPDVMSNKEDYENEIRYIKAKHILDRFYNEQGFYIAKVGKQKAIAEWLQGLPLRIEYYYIDIIELAKRMGSIEENPSKKTIERVEQGYFDFMALMIIEIENKILI